MIQEKNNDCSRESSDILADTTARMIIRNYNKYVKSIDKFAHTYDTCEIRDDGIVLRGIFSSDVLEINDQYFIDLFTHPRLLDYDIGHIVEQSRDYFCDDRIDNAEISDAIYLRDVCGNSLYEIYDVGYFADVVMCAMCGARVTDTTHNNHSDIYGKVCELTGKTNIKCIKILRSGIICDCGATKYIFSGDIRAGNRDDPNANTVDTTRANSPLIRYILLPISQQETIKLGHYHRILREDNNIFCAIVDNQQQKKIYLYSRDYDFIETIADVSGSNVFIDYDGSSNLSALCKKIFNVNNITASAKNINTSTLCGGAEKIFISNNNKIVCAIVGKLARLLCNLVFRSRESADICGILSAEYNHVGMSAVSPALITRIQSGEIPHVSETLAEICDLLPGDIVIRLNNMH